MTIQTCECGHCIDVHIEYVEGKPIAGECGHIPCSCKKYKEKDESHN